LAATVDLIAADGETAVAIEADVTSTADTDRRVAETVAAFGRLELALNAAGVLDATNPALPVDYDEDEPMLTALIHEATDAYWDTVLTVNSTGIFKSLLAELRQLVA
jgi:NAD(P)-dependent dehydrogenase (short-subunit alcohol dehydrogenase family)